MIEYKNMSYLDEFMKKKYQELESLNRKLKLSESDTKKEELSNLIYNKELEFMFSRSMWALDKKSDLDNMSLDSFHKYILKHAKECEKDLRVLKEKDLDENLIKDLEEMLNVLKSNKRLEEKREYLKSRCDKDIFESVLAQANTKRKLSDNALAKLSNDLNKKNTFRLIYNEGINTKENILKTLNGVSFTKEAFPKRINDEIKKIVDNFDETKFKDKLKTNPLKVNYRKNLNNLIKELYLFTVIDLPKEIEIVLEDYSDKNLESIYELNGIDYRVYDPFIIERNIDKLNKDQAEIFLKNIDYYKNRSKKIFKSEKDLFELKDMEQRLDLQRTYLMHYLSKKYQEEASYRANNFAYVDFYQEDNIENMRIKRNLILNNLLNLKKRSEDLINTLLPHTKEVEEKDRIPEAIVYQLEEYMPRIDLKFLIKDYPNGISEDDYRRAYLREVKKAFDYHLNDKKEEKMVVNSRRGR